MSIEIAMEIVAITMAVATVIVVVKLVPLLDRLQKTVKEAEQLLHNLNEDGPILLRGATEAVQNMNRIVRDLGEVIETIEQDVDESMSRLRRTMKRVYGLIQFGAGVMRIGWPKGIRALQGLKHRSPAYRSYYGKGLS